MCSEPYTYYVVAMICVVIVAPLGFEDSGCDNSKPLFLSHLRSTLQFTQFNVSMPQQPWKKHSRTLRPHNSNSAVGKNSTYEGINILLRLRASLQIPQKCRIRRQAPITPARLRRERNISFTQTVDRPINKLCFVGGSSPRRGLRAGATQAVWPITEETYLCVGSL